MHRGIDKKWDVINQHCNLTLEAFIGIVSFVFNNVSFLFDGRIYRQIVGTPMGGKIFPIIALCFMDKIVLPCLGLLGFHIPFFAKYVDDLVLAVPSENRTLCCKSLTAVILTFERKTNDSVLFWIH